MDPRFKTPEPREVKRDPDRDYNLRDEKPEEGEE
jgi:hypothetical protein